MIKAKKEFICIQNKLNKIVDYKSVFPNSDIIRFVSTIAKVIEDTDKTLVNILKQLTDVLHFFFHKYTYSKIKLK